MILPLEYFSNKKNIPFLTEVRQICKKENIPVKDGVFSFAVALLKKNGILQKEHVQKVLKSFPAENVKILSSLSLPDDEKDILGLIYQCLLTEGEKNFSGSYYTPPGMVQKLLKNSTFGKKGKSYLDPCCGSGAFLLAEFFHSPEELYGCDLDPVAVFIAKINLLCKYKEHIFFPNIFCCDFLAGKAVFEEEKEKVQALFLKKFDLIATNPPWGGFSSEKSTAKKSLKASSDTFSAFFIKSFTMLKEKGELSFLLPEAVLEIRKHAFLRKFILEETSLQQIIFPETKLFHGVMTAPVVIKVQKTPLQKTFLLEKKGKVKEYERSFFCKKREYIFSFMDEEALKILAKMEKHHFCDLSGSIFALGIVTGDNKKFLSKVCREGMEKVYTGKEISPCRLSQAKNYLLYDEKEFQQCAKKEYYHAKEKLVYRFISRKLVFAYDDTGSLFLNSANILIPELPHISIKTLLGILNSKVLNFYYMNIYNDLKVLKKALQALPLPFLTEDADRAMTLLAEKMIEGDGEKEWRLLEKMIANLYGLTDKEYAHIENFFLQEKKK